ncbi:glycosyltransferase family 2 protein [Flavobacterium hibernum]|uniref:Glycosyl transferase n=1 Tax=Flavobacterium hibernum TaxID=37752 RepID=A0A0D0EW87_9FLAO|nr:glycosyltransferase family A protein [Flavobacterium hibernum]KIO51301.1 glycosyl transferase [Flavobacterium hibernum]OXA85085.1 glycosyl transferase [Flavobacterium hibernum]STO19453.1 Chondroitin polymerase [Flavobacterium hibernum]
MAFFSVIIPLYNKENFIENTIQSVLNQTFEDFEIIVINDGSTDKSEEKLLQFKDSRIRYYSKNNEGVSITRNLGITLANANFVAFLDADDYWHPDFLKVMFDYCTRFIKAKVFTTAIEVETSQKTFLAQYSINKTFDFEFVNYFKASKKESVILTSATIFNKKVFDKVGVFDPNIKSGQDTDLWIRIGLVYPILFIWEVLVRYTHDENSLSKKPDLLESKMDFSKFTELEKTNSDLKYFLDLNRFSLAIKSKLAYNKTLFDYYYNGIDLKKISFKKRFLLLLPPYLLRFLIQLKLKMANLGFGSSVFK